MPHEQTQERAESSSFNVRFLTVDGKPLTVVGSTDAIASLERRLEEAASLDRADPERESQ